MNTTLQTGLSGGPATHRRPRTTPATVLRVVRRPRYLLPLVAMGLIVVYLAVVRPLLMPTGGTSLVELVLAVLLVLGTAVTAVLAVWGLLVAMVAAAVPATRRRGRLLGGPQRPSRRGRARPAWRAGCGGGRQPVAGVHAADPRR